jgi:hypothetical protein
MLKERQLEEVTWDKPGTSVHGTLLRVQKVKYSDGVGTKYLLKNTDGKLVSFKGATKLDLFLHYGDVGKLIEVVYVGQDATRETKPGMSPAKIFRVAVDEESGPGTPPTDDSPLITDDDIPF